MSLEVARRLIDDGRYMTLATADEQGRPWASPVWYAHVDHREFVWVSKPGARHSQNIERRPEVGIVIFDSRVPPAEAEAVYVEASAQQVAGPEIESAIETFSRRSVAQGLASRSPADVSGEADLRLYHAAAQSTYVLGPGDLRIAVA